MMVNHGSAQVDSIISQGASPFSPGGVNPVPDPPDRTAPGPDEPTNPEDPEHPEYDGGTTYGFVSVQFFVAPGAQQTTTVNPQKPLGWPNPSVDVNGVREIISKWLTPECKSFITTILEELTSKKNLVKGDNLLDVFDALVNDPSNKGIIRGNPPDGGRTAGGTIRGRIGKDGAIYLPGFDPRGTAGREQINLDDAKGVFHELLHLATKTPNLDKPLAKAIKNAGLGVGDFPTGEGDLDYNAYINNALREHCGIPYSGYYGRKNRL